MAFFKFRKAGDDAAPSAAQPESVEVLRRRARHRLIGAAVLVLIGIVGFPLLFDTQPRPVPVDIAIDIPDRNKAKPLVVPPAAPVAAASGAVSGPPVVAPPVVAKVPPTEALGPKEELIAQAPKEKLAPVPATAASGPVKTDAKVEPKPAPKAEVKAEAKAEAKPDDGERAKALLEGKPAQPAEAAPGDTRFVVQVGAFSDMAKAREAQRKLERAGLKNYIQTIDTKEGKRNRVRAGPFASKAEADKAVDKIKGLDLPVSVLSL